MVESQRTVQQLQLPQLSASEVELLAESVALVVQVPAEFGIELMVETLQAVDRTVVAEQSVAGMVTVPWAAVDHTSAVVHRVVAVRKWVAVYKALDDYTKASVRKVVAVHKVAVCRKAIVRMATMVLVDKVV